MMVCEDTDLPPFSTCSSTYAPVAVSMAVRLAHTPLTDYPTILGHWYVDKLHRETRTNITIKHISNIHVIIHVYTEHV